MTTATAHHEVIAPESFVIKHDRTGQYVTDAYYDQEAGRWTIEFALIDAMPFATADAARASVVAWRINPRHVKIARRLATVKLTDAGKADVAARRAARNADRKW